MTQRPNVLTKRVNIPETDTVVELFLFDCPGHDLCRPLVKRTIAECSYVILVCSAQRKETLGAAEGWLELFKDATMNPHSRGVLVSNFAFEEGEEYLASEATEFSRTLHLGFAQTNAFTGADCDVPFSMVAFQAYKHHQKSMEN
eukprot:gnl/Dysnectes_brevis/3732_a4784_1176.p1 GENE.gnl/Dysnectes_brevis/3732_a4784_1176~~gnl/Dysnectes_brevis/3732_a4784_1176.p1  ORF type:complete len:144 (+),score=2.25 gnl/Dysnectes_brevis/3732_a4784_1176:129-560(+)